MGNLPAIMIKAGHAFRTEKGYHARLEMLIIRLHQMQTSGMKSHRVYLSLLFYLHFLYV